MTNSTKAAAASVLGASASAAMEYSAITLTPSAMSTPSTASPVDITSVTYVMPASSSPASILVSSARTSGSLVSMAGVTPAFINASNAKSPQGTSSAHSPSSSSSLAKSSKPVTPAG